MAFWKKSEDPWDTVPEKKEAVNSFQQYVDQWNATLEREKAEKEAAEKARLKLKTPHGPLPTAW